ncbi:hypothetical protein J3R82DRAFT_11138 [Butyriboletus roseoflavus]|nr:hypothetical protein J3R82DRAFT_11138 [Butyriboletus roseoflavus]
MPRSTLYSAMGMGAQQVPSPNPIKKCHERVERFIGSPSETVKAKSGLREPVDTFRDADYYENGEGGMSEVFHGEKMNNHLLSPPAIG